LNVLLRLTASLAVSNSALPPVRRVRLSSSGLEWIGEDAPPPGSTGTLSAYMNPALPEALKISCTVTGERFDGQERVAQLRFNGLNDTLVGLLEKLIFRHHRRLIAGARLAAN
jgi:hypothetical protein